MAIMAVNAAIAIDFFITLPLFSGGLKSAAGG
jgi:hypothetical protein